jgi:hypothetical protein
VDDIYRPRAIVQDVWTLTRRCAVVLADLTDKNANVFYELGLAHAIGKPVILVAQAMADVPSDLRAIRVLIYDKNEPKWGPILGEKIVAAIGEVLASPSAVLPFGAGTPGEREQQEAGETRTANALREELESVRLQLKQCVEASQNYPPNEAEAVYIIRRSLRSGLATQFIENHLVARGLPRAWILATIAQERADATL